jgi:hypothetical protein
MINKIINERRRLMYETPTQGCCPFHYYSWIGLIKLNFRLWTYWCFVGYAFVDAVVCKDGYTVWIYKQMEKNEIEKRSSRTHTAAQLTFDRFGLIKQVHDEWKRYMHVCILPTSNG